MEISKEEYRKRFNAYVVHPSIANLTDEHLDRFITDLELFIANEQLKLRAAVTVRAGRATDRRETVRKIDAQYRVKPEPPNLKQANGTASPRPITKLEAIIEKMVRAGMSREAAIKMMTED